MSIVTSLMDKLQFVEAISQKVASVESKLTLLRALVLSTQLRMGRQWFSASRAEEFSREQLAQRGRAEYQGRFPLAR